MAGSKPDPKYCAMGSADGLDYLLRKRAGYALTPIFQALTNVGLRAGSDFDTIGQCDVNAAEPCDFLKDFAQELDRYGEALAKSGLTPAGRARAVETILAKLKAGAS
jgi:hypothetical protein